MFTIVTGGAASGKSEYAEALVMSLDGPRVYLAAMEPAGEEAARRIARHRALRAGKGFRTVECPSGLENAVLPAGANVLLEDLGNLAANEMFGPREAVPAQCTAETVAAEVLAVLPRCAHLTVVTNEIFSDGEDYPEETLQYMKALALAGRQLARHADTVVEVVCGLPNVLKGGLPWKC